MSSTTVQSAERFLERYGKEVWRPSGIALHSTSAAGSRGAGDLLSPSLTKEVGSTSSLIPEYVIA